MPPQFIIDLTHLQMAETISQMSKDPNTKVGVVILSSDKHQISTGYNGFVSGIDETYEKWKCPIKYEYVIHAELNALLFCPFDKKDSTLYSTHQPCHKCLQYIIQTGIKRIVYIQPYKNLEYPEIWNEHSKFIEIEQFSLC